MRYFFLVYFWGLPLLVFSQKKLSVEDIIQLSEENSVDAKQAERQAQISYWLYRFHQSNNKPRFILNGELPNLNRTIIPVTQNDGSETFRERSLATSQLDISLLQNIAPTGGTFFASSQLNRIDIFGTPNTTSYLSYPVLVGVRQPVGHFNQLKWANKIEPLRFIESRKKYREELEISKIKGIRLFFALLLAQENVAMNTLQKANADTLLILAKNRFSVGKITENELLRNEINALQAEQALAQATNEYFFAKRQLQIFLETTEDITLTIPKGLAENIHINEDLALEQVRQNSSKALALQRRIIEADKELSQAKANAGLKMDITLSFGLSRSANDIRNVYTRLQDQENARISFQIPILDWQRGKAEVKIATIQKQYAQIQAEQELLNLELELSKQIKDWQLAKKQWIIAEKAKNIAEKSYQLTLQDYQNGFTTITELDKAFIAKNLALQNYLRQLEILWTGYYTIRGLTLYDFEKNTPLK
ncbi:MAG: TolC family protein [Raineya sp.]